MTKWTRVVALTLASHTLAAQAGWSQATADQDSDRIVVAALYQSTLTGQRHLNGILDAVENHPLGARIEVARHPYIDESDGERLLLSLVQNDEVNIVLGPPDSRIFDRVKARQDELPRRVPVISWVPSENEPGDWFLSTGVLMDRRFGALADYLTQRWVLSVSVLFAENEDMELASDAAPGGFGRQAEEAFRRQLTDLGSRFYSALPFRRGDPFDQVLQVIERRPEAVGVFGGREDIDQVLGGFASAAPNFRPVFFAPMPVRSLHDDLDGVLFASVVRPESEDAMSAEAMPDEVTALSYDTTSCVLDVLPGLGTQWDPNEFRATFAANVLGGLGDARGRRSGMRFTGGQNDSEVYVYELSDGHVLHHPSTNVGLIRRIMFKLRLFEGRFGSWSVWSALGAIILTVWFAVRKDIDHPVGAALTRAIGSRAAFAALGLFQVSSSALLFLALVEFGLFPMGLLGAVGAGLAPTQFLRAGWRLGSGSEEPSSGPTFLSRWTGPGRALARRFFPVAPPFAGNAEELKRQHDEVSNGIRRALFLMLGIGFFFMMLLGQSDAALLTRETIKVPIADVEVDVVGFFIVGPLILVGGGLYLHILIGHWTNLGGNRYEHGLPFVFNLPYRTARFVSTLMMYWLVPAILFMFARRSAVAASPEGVRIGEVLGTTAVLASAATLFLQLRRMQPADTTGRLPFSGFWLLTLFLCWSTGSLSFLTDPRGLRLEIADLSGLDLSGKVFSNAAMRRVKLVESKLIRSDLSGANLSEADLSTADLTDADLGSTVLSGTNLSGASLLRTKLNYAKLQGAELNRAIFKDAELAGANLRTANLVEAILDGADLRSASFENANLAGASMAGVRNWRNADFRGAILTGVKNPPPDFVKLAVSRGAVH